MKPLIKGSTFKGISGEKGSIFWLENSSMSFESSSNKQTTFDQIVAKNGAPIEI